MLLKSSETPFSASRKRATIVNLIRDYASLGLLFIQGIVLVPVYLKYIDARLYGAWLATGSIIGFLGLLDFGLGAVIVQRCATISSGRSVDQLGALIGTTAFIIFILAVLPVLLASVLLSHVPWWVNIEGPEAYQISKAFMIAAVSTSMMFIAYGFGGIFLGLQRTEIISLQFIVSSIVGILSTLFFLHFQWGILSIASGLLVKSLLLASGHCIYLFWWVSKHLPRKIIRFDRSLFLDLFHQSVWVFVSKFSNIIANQSDNLIVAAMIDPRITTTLSLTRKSTDIVSTMVSRLSSAFLPSIANLSSGIEIDEAKSKWYMLKITKIVFMISMFCFVGVFHLNEHFVRFWVGHEFYGGTLLTGLICTFGIIFVVNTTIFNNIFAKGKIITASKAIMLESIVRVPVSILLCHYWGVNGVVIAGIFAVLPTSFLVQTRCFLKILNLSCWKDILFFLPFIIFKAAIPLLVIISLSILWTPTLLYEFVLFILLYSLVTFCAYYLADRDIRDITVKIFPFFIKK